jgi:hypothetical protein
MRVVSTRVLPEPAPARISAAFGVGVADFDGFPGHAGEHVGGAVAVAVGHVLHRRDDGYEVHRQLHADGGQERAHHRRRAAHVVLHLLDAALRLEVDAAGVEGDALADQHVRLGIAAAVVLQHDELGRIGRSLRDGEQRAHAQCAHLLAIENLARDRVEAAGEILRLLGEVGGIADVRRQVAQFAGERDAGGDRLALRQRGGGIVAGADRERRQPGFIALLVLGTERGGVAITGMRGRDRRLAHVPCAISTGDGQFGEREQSRIHRSRAQRARGVADGLEVLGHAELAGIAQSDHQHAWCLHAGQVVRGEHAAGLATDVAPCQQSRQPAAAGRVDRLCRGAQGRGRAAGIAAGEGAYHDAIGGGIGGGGVVQGEFEGHRTDSRGKGM